MKDSVEQAQIDAANAYESLFVPALFEQWTRLIADAARVGAGQRVLDVACGTGVLARDLAGRVGASGSVTGLDPSAGMLAVARERAPNVDWRRGTAESLPFEAGSFDAVVSQFGLMFFTDPPRAVGEMLRVLKPGGRLAVAVWGAIENNPLYEAEVELLARLAGRPAADALRAPFASAIAGAWHRCSRTPVLLRSTSRRIRGRRGFRACAWCWRRTCAAGCPWLASTCPRTPSVACSRRPTAISASTSGARLPESSFPCRCT
jgi:ubiquinone/menaquinone biosynthesis C-methylase UbiE